MSTKMKPFYALLLLCILGGHCGVINLLDDNNHTLDYYLCGEHHVLESDTIIILQSNITHYIQPNNNSVCLTSNIFNITIMSDNHPATVQCTGHQIINRQGFVFHNVTNLTIFNIKFEGCGGILTNPLVQFLNGSADSYFYFGEYQPAALVLDMCTDLSVSNIEIMEYLGFGMILSNSYGAIAMDNITIHNPVPYDNFTNKMFEKYLPSLASGSGLLIYYQKFNGSTCNQIVSNANINICSCNISGRFNGNYNGHLIQTLTDITEENYVDMPWPVVGAGGLTVIIVEARSNNISLNFYDLHVTRNTGFQAGGIVLLYIDVLVSVITINNAVIKGNCIIDNDTHYDLLGQSVTTYFLFFKNSQSYSSDYDLKSPLTITNSSFGGLSQPQECLDENTLGNFTEILVIQMPQDVINYNVVIRDSVFNGMVGSPNFGTGIAFYASSLWGCLFKRSLSVRLENITAINFQCSVHNSTWSCYNVGVFAFVRVLNASFIGGRFLNSSSSSVIFAKYSDLYLSGEPIFCRNQAETFGVIRLIEDTFLYFVEPLHAKFVSNKALLGAGIYAVEETVTHCVLQYLPEKYYDISNYTDMNITIEMNDNKAELAGNFLYGSPIEKCVLYRTNLGPSLDISLLINSTFKSTSSDGQDVSSIPWLICSCTPKVTPLKCEQQMITSSAHPGQIIQVSVAAFGVLQRASTFALVTAQFSNVPTPDILVSIQPEEVITHISSGQCTNLTYTIKHSITNLSSYPVNNIRLDLAPYTQTPRFHIDLTLLPCPPGFHPVDMSCWCETLYDNLHLDWNLQNGSVSRPPNSWLGFVDENKNYGYSKQCPPMYCHPEVSSVSLSDPDSLCFGERTGVLCGQCKDNFSLVFGTEECRQCSNAYLATILVYAATGILLVFLIFLLQLTLTTGTINGLIFYVNIIGTTDGYLLGHSRCLSYLRIFIGLLNLNLGFPMCFYNGMNELAMRCLQFVFPIYIWSIVFVIIILSRYSYRLARITARHSVAVLVTLIYLSYSKILATIVNTMTFTTIKTEHTQYTVWYFYGDLKFGRGLHLIPLFLSLAMLLLFILPVTFITTLAPFLRRFRIINRYMPLTDAVFAPYKDKWRFWFGARLCLLVIAYIIAAVLRGLNVKLLLGFQHILVVGFSLVQAFVQPFKNTLIGVLDLSFMLNFALIAFAVVYFETQGLLLHVASGILMTLALLVFIGIIFFHCCKVLKPCCRGHIKNGSLLDVRAYKPINYGTQSKTVTHSEIPDVQYCEYREPLLSSDDERY